MKLLAYIAKVLADHFLRLKKCTLNLINNHNINQNEK